MNRIFSVLLIGLLLLTQVAFSEPPSSDTAKIPLKYKNIGELVDLMTVISLEGNLKSSSGFIEGKYKLSPRLVELKKKYGEVAMYLSPHIKFGIRDDRVSMKPAEKEQWLELPMSSLKVKLPKFEFRNGELGLLLGKSYVTDGTEIRIDGQIYRYSAGKWTAVDKPIISKQEKGAKPAMPVTITGKAQMKSVAAKKGIDYTIEGDEGMASNFEVLKTFIMVIKCKDTNDKSIPALKDKLLEVVGKNTNQVSDNDEKIITIKGTLEQGWKSISVESVSQGDGE